MKKNKQRSTRSKKMSSTPTKTATVASKQTKENKTSNVVSLSLTQLSTAYVMFIIINSIVLYLANIIFPKSVVLGTHLLSPIIALLQSMLVFTLIVVGFMPLLEIAAKTLKIKMSEKNLLLALYVINVVGLWLTARFAELVGLGISSWIVAVLLGLVLCLLQDLANKIFKAIE